MLKDKLSRTKRLILIGAVLPLLAYLSFCFFTDTPMVNRCLYGSNGYNLTDEQEKSIRKSCYKPEEEYRAYLFWNILKDETTDPLPGGQGSKFRDLINELKVNK